MQVEKRKSFAERLAPLRASRRLSRGRLPEVGTPTNFKHVVHIGTDSHHVDTESVPSAWQDILDIAKRCQELDDSSNSSNESTSHKKEEGEEESQHHSSDHSDESLMKETPISSEGTMNSLMFETPDLMEDVLGCLDDKYRKFLMG